MQGILDIKGFVVVFFPPFKANQVENRNIVISLKIFLKSQQHMLMVDI